MPNTEKRFIIGPLLTHQCIEILLNLLWWDFKRNEIFPSIKITTHATPKWHRTEGEGWTLSVSMIFPSFTLKCICIVLHFYYVRAQLFEESCLFKGDFWRINILREKAAAQPSQLLRMCRQRVRGNIFNCNFN